MYGRKLYHIEREKYNEYLCENFLQRRHEDTSPFAATEHENNQGMRILTCMIFVTSTPAVLVENHFRLNANVVHFCENFWWTHCKPCMNEKNGVKFCAGGEVWILRRRMMKMIFRTSEGNVGQTCDSLHSSSHIQPLRLDQGQETQKTYLTLRRWGFSFLSLYPPPIPILPLQQTDFTYLYGLKEEKIPYFRWSLKWKSALLGIAIWGRVDLGGQAMLSN